MTTLLTRTDLHGVLDLDQTLAALRAGFTRHPPAGHRLVVPIPAQASAQHAVPGPTPRTSDGTAQGTSQGTPPGPSRGTATALASDPLPGIPAYAVKVNAKFPHTTPALRGVLCLHDASDGTLLALMDSATITAGAPVSQPRSQPTASRHPPPPQWP